MIKINDGPASNLCVFTLTLTLTLVLFQQPQSRCLIRRVCVCVCVCVCGHEADSRGAFWRDRCLAWAWAWAWVCTDIYALKVNTQDIVMWSRGGLTWCRQTSWRDRPKFAPICCNSRSRYLYSSSPTGGSHSDWLVLKAGKVVTREGRNTAITVHKQTKLFLLRAD